jgi:hypothetical protein
MRSDRLNILRQLRQTGNFHERSPHSSAVKMNDNTNEEIRVVPPMPGTCPVCAAKHRKDAPHDKNSVYFQNWFYHRHRRFPTWEDAMEHCSEKTKASFREKIRRKDEGAKK